MRLKRWSILVSMVLMLCILTVACSNAGDPPATPPSNSLNQNNPDNVPEDDTGDTESSFRLDEPATVTLITNAAEFNNNLMVYQNIFEATNIRIDGQFPAGNYTDAVALAMAGGDIPDVLMLNNNTLPKRYGSQGALLDFNEYLDQMPNLKSFWEERPDLKARATTHDGKTYQVINEGLAYTNHIVWMYRKDVFEEHGIEVPATWDELYAVMQQLKELYPNSYPLTFRNNFETIDSRMLPSFGINQGIHPHLDTREMIYGQTQDEYRDMLGYLNSFYTERLMNQDFLSITVEQWIEMMTTGRAFITVDYIGRIQTMNEAMSEEGAELAMMPPPSGNDGPAYLQNMTYMLGGLSVYRNTPNLDAALHYIDFLYSDEGSELVSWGKEGETYEVVDGQRRLTVGEDLISLRNATGIGGFGAYGKFDSEATMTLLPEQYRPYYDEVLDYIYPEDHVPSFTDQEEEQLIITMDQINKHKETVVSRFILGDRPLSEWEQYLQEMERLGLPGVLELYKTAYDRMGIQ
ncbi:extracellular solute-binding protein [Paenibacillus sp. 1P07SE]|uniref:extracellular solute-binding protein n=1 Tax=Paenibacillus sp. 1P07SE TaxID=3132209 RepID=UPI0039A47B48